MSTGRRPSETGHLPETGQVCRSRSRIHRWLLAGAGVLLVGIAALGVILPGLPTTIFLIGASWCFARSCPWLEERLIRVRFFRPFLVYIDRPTEMPRRAIVTTVVVMWLAIALSVTLVTLGDDPRPRLAGFIVGLGVVGSLVLATIDRRRQRMTDRRTFDPGSAAGS